MTSKCKRVCASCPFMFSNHSEQVQNYACLPTPYEIIQMKNKSGHTWGCHETDKGLRRCQGFINYGPYLKYDFDFESGGIINPDDWVNDGEQIAIERASNG